MSFSVILEKAKSYLPHINEARLKNAYNFAKKAHCGQKRLDGHSYFSHPDSVAELLTHFYADEDILIAALLHDVLEDTKCTIKDIERKFGSRIAFLVNGVTKLDKAQYPYNTLARKIESLKKFFKLSKEDLRVILIKLADRLHNMETADCFPAKRRIKFANETFDIYIPIANLLGIWAIKSKLEDFCFKYSKPAQYNKIKDGYQRYQAELKEVEEKTIEIIQNGLKKNKLRAKIEAQKKSIFSYHQELANNEGGNGNLRILCFYIIVSKIQDCYMTLGILHGLFKPKYNKVRDYIAIPKANGYQGIHTTVFGVNGVITEFQIKTSKMHKINEFGILSDIYKISKKNPVKASEIMKEKTKWLYKILEIGDEVSLHENFLKDLKMDIFQNRIFVFTPKGDIIDLPQGATALDFAYIVHADIGNRAVKTKINGTTLPISTQLHTGDTVEIITSKKNRPRLEWLNLVKTADAKHHIKSYFKKESDEECCKAGEKLLEAELMRFYNIKLSKVSGEKIKKALERFKVKNLKQLLIMVGRGEVLPKEIINILFSEKEILAGGIKSLRQFKKKTHALYPVEVVINYKDRVGLFRDIAASISKFRVNIAKVSIKTTGNKLKSTGDTMEIILEIKNFNQLLDIFSAIEQIDGVINIRKK